MKGYGPVRVGVLLLNCLWLGALVSGHSGLRGPWVEVLFWAACATIVYGTLLVVAKDKD